MLLNLEYLDKISPGYTAKGYSIPKWIQFSKAMINDGWTVRLRRSHTTVSKYIFVFKGREHYKVRFSNHKAAKSKERVQDSDFYVGIGNKGVMTTEQLLKTLIK